MKLPIQELNPDQFILLPHFEHSMFLEPWGSGKVIGLPQLSQVAFPIFTSLLNSVKSAAFLLSACSSRVSVYLH